MIVSSKITQNSLQRHGERYCRDCHTDHLGGRHVGSFKVMDGTNLRDILNARASLVNNSLAEKESMAAVDAVEAGRPLPALEFTDITKVRAEFNRRKLMLEDEITDLSSRKANIEGAE